MGLLDKWNKNKFSIYNSEEKTVLKLIESFSTWFAKTLKQVDENTELSNNNKNKKVSYDDLHNKYKLTLTGTDSNFNGMWQGLKKPTLSEEGAHAQVEKNMEDIQLVNKQLEQNPKLGYTNTVIDTWKKRFENRYIDVMDFGVVGNANYYDSVTDKYYVDSGFTTLAHDDTVAIRNAVNYLISIGGGTLLFPKGNFWITSTIEIYPNKHLPITLKGVAQINMVDTTLKYGSRIICDTTYPFKVKNTTGFKVENLGFIATQTGTTTAGDPVLEETMPTFKSTYVFSIFTTRFEFKDIACVGVKRLIYQTASTDSVTNYSDFCKVKNIYFRYLQESGIDLFKCDVTTVENIYAERSAPTCIRLLLAYQGQQVNIRNVASAMHYRQATGYTTVGNGCVQILGCNGVNISNIYNERQYYWNSIVYVEQSTNVHIDNIGEHGLDVDYTVNPIVKIDGSKVYIKGIHSWSVRKTGVADVVITNTNGNSELSIEDVDIRTLVDGTTFDNTAKRNIWISGVPFLNKLRTDTKYLKLYYDSGTNSFKIVDYDGNDMTSLFGTPVWDTDGVKLQTTMTYNGFSSANTLLVREISPNTIYVGGGVIGYRPVTVLAKKGTFFKIAFFDTSGTRITTPDVKCLCSLNIV